ncbi:MAG: class I SAM-dependent methyltransferase [Deltaproteobacteria bacterium]|nr:class I SAM-dependent methyltransferase [Deltaproteobacteria bacterium]
MSRLFAGIYDWFMRDTERACLAAWRATLLGPLRGHVVEVGAGTGANLAHYPSDLASLTLCEPDAHMRAKLQHNIAQSASRETSILDASVESLPMQDASVDVIVCTLVLCSVSDPALALKSFARVLRPGGSLVYIEHVAAHNDPTRLRLQRRIDGVWSRVAEGCHVTRDTAASIRQAGFEVVHEQRESMRKALPWLRPTIRGVALWPLVTSSPS